jgi:outer membrane protein TolC
MANGEEQPDGAINLNEMMELLLDSTHRVRKLEQIIQSLVNKGNISQNDIDQADQKALDELQQQFPDLDIERRQ